MQLDETVERVCRLAEDFYRGRKSMVQLAVDSGVRACRGALATELLASYIAAHPDVVEDWLSWSANKRVTSGWYFKRDGNRFVVGHHPDGDMFTFAEPSIACAEFVVREVNAFLAISQPMPSN
jgi:hypothetical protein